MMVGLAALDPPYVLKRNWRCGNGLWRLARGRASVQSVLLASSPERNKNTITLQGPQAPYFTQPRQSLRAVCDEAEPRHKTVDGFGECLRGAGSLRELECSQ